MYEWLKTSRIIVSQSVRGGGGGVARVARGFAHARNARLKLRLQNA